MLLVGLTGFREACRAGVQWTAAELTVGSNLTKAFPYEKSRPEGRLRCFWSG